MSDTVDTRVVRMEFDNRQFERNIKKTSQSLENLKQNLDFKGLGDSLDEVKVKISALDIAVTTFVANIANRLTNVAVNLVKSLSVDNIASGWSKFGEKTISVATMMAQKIRIAGEEITDMAKKTEIVDEQLALLNWFSDETSYSFNDMVNTVGKFTAAGQDLDVSVKAMEGIATWAALSGQNAQTASRAMYQLAQAMGKGKIQRIDWMSIQNSNMDTEEFRETILETAVALNQLTKEGDKFVTKTGKKFTKAQFTDMLSEGWFTSEVLVQGLGKYSAAIDDIYEISQREGLLASEVVEKYGDTLDQFGVKAFKAAQEARTFSDVINAIKDAVTSKWMTTFESIFGNREEAIKLWSDLANELYDVFAESGNFRNDILEVWRSFGGRDDLFARGGDNQGAFWNLYDAIISVRDLIKSAWNTVFPLTEMEEYSAQVSDIGNKIKDITKRIREFTEKLKMSEATSSRLSKIFQGLFNILKLGINILKAVRFILDPLIDIAKQLINDVLDQFSYYGNKVVTIGYKFEYIVIKIRDLLSTLLDSINPSKTLGLVFDFIKKIFNIISDFDPIRRLTDYIKVFVDTLKETTNVKEDLTNFFNMFKSIFNFVAKVISQVIGILFKLLPIMSKVINIAIKGIGYIIGVLSKLLGFIGKLVTNIFDFLSTYNLFEKIKNSIVDFLSGLYTFLKPLLNLIIKLFTIIGEFVKNILLTLPNILKAATKAISNSGIIKVIGNILNGIIDVIKEFISTAGKVSSNIAGGLGGAIKSLFSGLLTFIKGLIPVLQILMIALGKMLEIVGTLINKLANMIINVLTNKGVTKFLKIAFILGIIALVAVTIYNLVWTIATTIHPLRSLVTSITDTFDSIAEKLRSKVFETVARSILMISIAIALLASINEADLVKGLAALIVMSSVILGIMFVLTRMTDSINIIHRRSRSIKKSIIGIFDQFRENRQAVQNMLKIRTIVSAISSIAKSLLVVTASLYILSKVPENDIWRALGVAMAIMGFISGLIIFTNKYSSNNPGKIGKTLKSFTGIVGLLLGVAISIRILSSQTTGNTFAATTNILIMLSGIIGILYILNKISLDKRKLTKSILAISSLIGGLLIISTAIRILASSKLSAGSIAAATGGILVMLYSLIGILILVDKFVSNKAGAKFGLFALSLIPLLSAMLIMASVIGVLSLINAGKMWNSIAAITALLVSLTGIAVLIDIFISGGAIAHFIAFSVAITIFGAAMTIMSGVIGILSAINAGKIWIAISAIAGFISIVALAIKLIGLYGSIKFGIFSVSLIKFGAAMSIMTANIIALGQLNPDQLKRGRKAIQGFIAVVALAIKLIGIFSAVKFGLFSISLGMFGSAMMIIAGVIDILGSMNTGSLWKAIAAIATLTASIVILASAIQLTHSAASLPALALGLLIFAAAMLPLTTSLIALSGIPWSTLFKGIAGLAASLLVLIGAAKLAQPLMGFILGLSSALLIAGVGMLAMGAGLIMLAAGISAVAVAATVGFEGIRVLVVGLANILVDVLFTVLQNIFDRLGELIPSLFNAIGSLVDGILLLLGEKGPAIVSVVVELIAKVLDAIASNAESIFESVFTILEVLLIKLNDHINPIVDQLIKIFLKVIDKLIEYIPQIVDKLVKLLVAIVETLFRKIDELIDVLVDNIFNFLAKIIVAFSRKVIALAGLITKVVLILIAAVIRLTISSLGALSELIIIFIGSFLMLLLRSFLGMSRVIFAVLQTAVKEVVDLLIDVIAWFFPALGKIGRAIGSAIIGGLIAFISESYLWAVDLFDFIFGTNYADQIRESMTSASQELLNGSKSLINELSGGVDQVKKEIQKARKGIDDVVDMTSNEANAAVKNGINSINKTVSDSIGMLGDTLNQFGEDAGVNLMAGVEEGTKNSEALGNDIADSLSVGFKNGMQIKSPSKVFARFGEFLMQGLSIGIDNSEGETEYAITDVINKSLKLANDIISDQENDDITIRVGMDISGVEAQTSRIQDIMSGINNPSITPSGVNADYNSRAMNRRNSNSGINTTTNNSNEVTYNNTFNISSTDPSESAEEIDKILQQQAMRRKLAHGY